MTSYGVVASKPTEIRVVPVGPSRSAAPERGDWTAGRLTLTTLNLSFVPSGTSPAVLALTVRLEDVLSVESSPGRLRRTVIVRTDTVVLHARVTGPAAFAKRVATSVEACRRRNAATEHPPRHLRSEL